MKTIRGQGKTGQTNPAAEWVAGTILRYRWLTLALLVAATVGFALQIPRIVFQVSPEGMRLVGHPDTLYYEEYIRKYGSDEIVVMELWCEDVFSPEIMKKISRLTDVIEQYENVYRVVSLSNANDIRGGSFGIEIAPFLEEIPETEPALEKIRREVHDNPLYHGNLVSRDDQSTLLIVELDRSEEDFPQKRRELVRRILDLAREEQSDGIEIYVAGFPVIGTVLPMLMIQDQRIFIPLILLLMTLTLYAAFRNLWGILLPLATVIISVLWTMGFLVLAGKQVEIVTNVLPPLVLVIALADVVHILAHYQEELQGRKQKAGALKDATAYVLVPCLLTSITTSIGFASLMVSSVRGVRDLGLLASFGVMAAFVVSITFVPAILSFLPSGTFKRTEKKKEGALDRFLARLARFNESNRKLVLAVTLLLIGLAVAGLFRLKVETTLIKYLKEDNPVAVAVRHIEDHLSGTTTLDVVFDFGEPGAVKEPVNLEKVKQMESYLKGLPLVTNASSLVDFLERMNQVFHDGDPAYDHLPGARAEIAQFLLLYSMSGDEEDLSKIVDHDYRTAVITARLKTVGSSEMERFIKEVKSYVAKSFPDTNVRATGVSVLVTNSIGAIVKGQVQSLGLAMAIICVLMSLLFRSLRLGLLSMIPNTIPILITLGLMGWLGIDINTATAVISCVAIGIAVDDTIHYLTRFRKEYGARPDEALACARSLTSTGRALFFTSFVLTFGFLVLIFSNFKPLIYFGLLTGVTMVSALVGDLVLLPVLLMVLKPMRNKGA